MNLQGLFETLKGKLGDMAMEEKARIGNSISGALQQGNFNNKTGMLSLLGKAGTMLPGIGGIAAPIITGLISNEISQGEVLKSIADARNSLSVQTNPYQMKKGGYLKNENTYVTKDGRETRRGLWANVYLKKKKQGKQEGGIIDNKTGENDKSYNTKLTKEEEKNFRKWYSEVSKYKNLDPNPDAENHYYDYRGYWKNENRDNILQDNSDAHFIDKYKKPGHPTFSTDSIYSNKTEQGGVWSQDNKGTWYFKHSPYTEKYLQRTTEYLDGSGEYSITTKNDTIRNFDDFYNANNKLNINNNNKLNIKQNVINDTRKEYKNGGMIDNSMVDGGRMMNVSDDAQQVKANNPQETDSVETPQAFLDHNEMLIDMPDGGKFVFSDFLKDPETGESFATIAKGLIEKRDSMDITEEDYNMYITELANDNEKAKNMNNKKKTMKKGGKMMYAEGGEMMGMGQDPMMQEAMMEGEPMQQEGAEQMAPDVMPEMGVEGDMGMENMTEEGLPVDMPNGQTYVFSPDLKDPETGMTFASAAQNMKTQMQNGNMSPDEYQIKIKQLADKQESIKSGMSPEQKAGLKCGGYMKSKKAMGGYINANKFKDIYRR